MANTFPLKKSNTRAFSAISTGKVVFYFDIPQTRPTLSRCPSRKGLELTWNVLNLVDSAAMHGSSLKYAWLSDGTEVSAKADDGNGNGVQKRYLGSFVLTSNTEHSADEATEVESIAWDEGRIFFDVSVELDAPVDPVEFPGGMEPVMDSVIVDSLSILFNHRDCWFAGDHLGNIRTVIDITSDLVAPQVLEQNDYLPFGTKIQNPDLTCWMYNRWQYAGKEAQRFAPGGVFNQPSLSGGSTIDLGLLNFGARMYDPFTARWTAVDPMAPSHLGITPFLYCFGNPIKYFDPKGLDGYSGSNGEYVWFDKMDVESFSDINHIQWTRVTSDKQKWDEAMTIREANIEALVSLGFDRTQSSQDVRLFDESSSLFTKESLLLNPEQYIATWEPSLNSATMKTDALTSNEVDGSGYQLKFYPQKGSDSSANSLGLIKANQFTHKVEAAIEAFERIVFGNQADNDPIYDMHVKNARGFLNRSEE